LFILLIHLFDGWFYLHLIIYFENCRTCVTGAVTGPASHPQAMGSLKPTEGAAIINLNSSEDEVAAFLLTTDLKADVVSLLYGEYF
jgi:hypothetical protein